MIRAGTGAAHRVDRRPLRLEKEEKSQKSHGGGDFHVGSFSGSWTPGEAYYMGGRHRAPSPVAASGLADRFDPRRVFAICGVLAALCNAALLLADGLGVALVTRFACGFCLAGVYPPAMKMIATWFKWRRGLAVGRRRGVRSTRLPRTRGPNRPLRRRRHPRPRPGNRQRGPARQPAPPRHQRHPLERQNQHPKIRGPRPDDPRPTRAEPQGRAGAAEEGGGDDERRRGQNHESGVRRRVVRVPLATSGRRPNWQRPSGARTAARSIGRLSSACRSRRRAGSSQTSNSAHKLPG